MEILTRGGSLIFAVVLLFLAKRLHTKASGKGEKPMKIIATVLGFGAGLFFLGTVVGSWMGSVAGASPYIAAALAALALGGLLIDWFADGKPDKFAFWCAVFLPLAVTLGYAQLSNLGDDLDRRVDRLSTTISTGGR